MRNNNSSATRVSSQQLVTLLVISRSVSLLTRSAAFNVAAGAWEAVVGLVISIALILVLDSAPISAAISRIPAGIVTKIVLAAFFIVAAVNTLLSFAVFLQSESEVVFPALLIILLVMAVVFYALTNGIEGIARFALMAAVIFVLILGFTIAANASGMDITNLGYPKSPGWNSIAGIVIANTLLCPEIPAYFALKRFVRKEDAKKHGLRSFYIIQSIIIGIFTVAQELVFGTLTNIQKYPVYSLAVVGEFSIFQRLDVIHLAVWCIVTVVKLCVLTIACIALLRDIMPKLQHIACSIVVCAVTALGAVLMLGVFASKPEIIELCLIAMFAISAITFLGAARRRGLAGQSTFKEEE